MRVTTAELHASLMRLMPSERLGPMTEHAQSLEDEVAALRRSAERFQDRQCRLDKTRGPQ